MFLDKGENTFEMSQSCVSVCDLIGIYLFKVKNRNNRRIETLEQDVKYDHWRRSSVIIVNIVQYSTPCSSVSIVNLEQVNAGWGSSIGFFFLLAILKSHTVPREKTVRPWNIQSIGDIAVVIFVLF